MDRFTNSAQSEQLLTTVEMAARLRVKPSWIYSHADDLGVIRLGKYLRFDWDFALKRLAENSK
jgi:hypothetical protein